MQRWHPLLPLNLLSFQLVAEDQAHDHADNTDDQTAKNRMPETIHTESEAERLSDPAGEQKHSRVDHDGE